jgi:hypothetical protein
VRAEVDGEVKALKAINDQAYLLCYSFPFFLFRLWVGLVFCLCVFPHIRCHF